MRRPPFKLCSPAHRRQGSTSKIAAQGPRSVTRFTKNCDGRRSHTEGGTPHVSTSLTSSPILPADGSLVGREPGAIVRTRSAPAEPAGADFTAHRHHRHHHRVSPAAGE